MLGNCWQMSQFFWERGLLIKMSLLTVLQFIASCKIYISLIICLTFVTQRNPTVCDANNREFKQDVHIRWRLKWDNGKSFIFP